MPTKRKHKYVALSIIYHRDIYMGISRYLQLNERWRIEYLEYWASHLHESTYSKWRGDGIIVQALSKQVIDTVASSRNIAVNISDSFLHEAIPTVRMDNPAIGRMGAEYLLSRGFNNLMFCGHSQELHSRERAAGFMSCLESSNANVIEHDLDTVARSDSITLFKNLQKAIKDMPKPMAIMTCDDGVARVVARACQGVDFRVPEEVAILGVDNDVARSGLDLVPISSIQPDFERVGYQAAANLSALMQGKKLKKQVELIPPVEVVTRLSTDTNAIANPVLIKAINYINTNYTSPISVEDVATVACVSRRTLNRLYNSHLNRNPTEDLMQLRLKHAQKLIRETNIPLSRIANLSGFSGLNHLGRTFQRELNLSPTAYRENFNIG